VRGLAVALVALVGCFKPKLTERLPCAQPDDWCPPPQACVAGICAGDVSGPGSADAAVITNANYMFTTSTSFDPDTLANADILDTADDQCNRLGQKLRPGTYMAWLGTDTSDAAARIAANTNGTPGWVRPDGKPFTSSLADLQAGTVYFPPRIDDTGADVVVLRQQTAVMTTLDPNGCISAGVVVIGLAPGDEPAWRAFDARGCANDYWLYCFEVDLDTPVAPPAVDPDMLLAFVTRSTYPSTDGVPALDDACQAEGNAAGSSARRFLALVATTTANARSRFTGGSKPWTRLDGVELAQASLDKFDAPLSIAPPMTVGDPPMHVDTTVAFGAPDLTSKATTNNCTDWGAASPDAFDGKSTMSDNLGFLAGTIACDPNHFYCLEAP
jgi:hypothetical protein